MKVATSVVFVKMIVKLAAILLGIIFTCNMIAMPGKILAVTVHALMHAAYIIWSLYCNCILSVIGAVMNETDTSTTNGTADGVLELDIGPGNAASKSMINDEVEN